MDNKKLNLFAPVGKTGYGVAGFNILKALLDREWDVSLFSHGESGRDNNPIDMMLIESAKERGVFFDYDAPCLNIWHQYELSQSIGKGPYIAFPFFELDTFDDRERHHLNYPDYLFTTSQWGKDVLLKNKISKDENIFVVPLGIDASIFNPNIQADRNTDSTVFLNCGKWEVRKGHDILIDVFSDTFSVDDNVELWMLPHNHFISSIDQQNWESMYLDTTMGRAGKVKIFPWQKEHEDIARIMSQSNCGVFPSRGEGWNLELLEMMAMGKPVIATNYSAHTQFCDKYNSYLIDIDYVESAYDGMWFFEQGNWATIGDDQLEQLSDHMRTVHENVQRPGKFINDAGIETGRQFTWENIAMKIETILLDILEN